VFVNLLFWGFCLLFLFFVIVVVVLFNIINIVSYIYYYLSRISHLESGFVASPPLHKEPALTDVTSFEASVSAVIRRRFAKVRNGHRFENWTPILGLDVD
jgi:hypothetical protein